MSDPAVHPDPRGLLPHGPAAVFVERILARDAQSLSCRVVPGSAEAELTDGEGISTAMAVEYMAQAVGVFADLQREPDTRRRPGFVIAIRDLCLHVDAFAVGEPLVVRVEWQRGDDRLAQFGALIERDGVPLASALLSVYRPAEGEIPA